MIFHYIESEYTNKLHFITCGHVDDTFINEYSHDLMVMPYTTDVFTIYTPLRGIIVFKFLHSWAVY